MLLVPSWPHRGASWARCRAMSSARIGPGGLPAAHRQLLMLRANTSKQKWPKVRERCSKSEFEMAKVAKSVRALFKTTFSSHHFPAKVAKSVRVLFKITPPVILRRIRPICRKRWQRLQVRTSLPHAPGARMTVVTHKLPQMMIIYEHRI